MQRRLYTGRDLARVLNADELRLIAQRKLPHFVFEYVDSGAEDERTMAHNRRGFDDYRFAPRTLVDTSARTTGTTLLGKPIRSPIVVAPTGFNGMLTRDADLHIARAAARHGIPSTLSTVSNVSLETVAQASHALQGQPWFQLYMLKDRRCTEQLVERALQADHDTLVVTTDAAIFGNREWDKRNFTRPMQLSLRSKLDVLAHPRWLFDVMVPHGAPRFSNIEGFTTDAAAGAAASGAVSAKAGSQYIASQMTDTLTWDDIAWVRRLWPRKLLVKGVLCVDDALRARDAGADGVVAGNHGGRQLDSCCSALDVLRPMRAALGKHTALLAESGFRRGTDVVKALALGADAVMIGRPLLYAVAAAGEAGVAHMLTLLSAEIHRTLGQLGVRSCAEVDERIFEVGASG